jgi:long-subunit acyl-CoA synthetase (AMP-forming)
MDTGTMPTADGLSLESDAGRALSSPTIVELFRQQVRALRPRAALRRYVDGSWQPLTWAEYGDAVCEIAKVRRNAVGEQYHDLIEQMYAERA